MLSVRFSKSIVDNYNFIEQDFKKTRFYLEWTPDNFMAVSSAFEELLLNIGDEFSSYITRFVSMYHIKEKVYFYDFIKCITEQCNCLFFRGVSIKDVDLIIFPFLNLDEKHKWCPPDWWSKYNKLKHNKYSKEKVYVSLKDTMCALASLALVNKCILFESCPNILNLTLSEYKICNQKINSGLFDIYEDRLYYFKSKYYLLNQDKYVTEEELDEFKRSF